MKSPLPVLAGLLLAGCYTELPVGPSADTEPEPPPVAFAALKKGLSAEQVRALLGAPAEIKPYRSGGATGEIWVYHRTVSARDQQVPIGSREVPVTNPLTGVTGMGTEPVYQIQTITVTETVELLMLGPWLVEWKTRQATVPTIHPH